MQHAAFLCVICAICGRITRKRTQSISTEETQKSPADYADNRRQTPNNKTSPPSQPVFLCEIMQHAAFVCVICAICGRITCNRTQSISTEETQKSPADYADNRRQTPNNKPQLPAKHINHINLSFSAK